MEEKRITFLYPTTRVDEGKEECLFQKDEGLHAWMDG